MRRALQAHGRTVAVIVAMLALALAVTGVILVNQRVALPGWLPGGAERYERFQVELSTAQAVTPGQGQQVLIAGVDVGDITDVHLERGAAVIDIRVKARHARKLRRDASALLRPKSGLYDMSVELDLGRSAQRLRPGARIPDSRTAVNVHLDELLASLDGDTRLALKMLVDGAGEGLPDDGRALAGTLQRLSPVQRNLRLIGEQMEDRNRQIRAAVTLMGRVNGALADGRGDVVRAIRSTSRVLGTMGRRDGELRSVLGELPRTLAATDGALDAGTSLARELQPASAALMPVAEQLAPTLRDQRPFLQATAPVIREQLEPFARRTRQPVRRLEDFAQAVHEGHADSDAVTGETSRFLNMLAYDPPGNERGFLFYQQWLNHNLPWMYSTQDAHGPIRRARLSLSCSSLATLTQTAEVNPQAAFLGTLLGALGKTPLCPPATKEGPDATGPASDSPQAAARSAAGAAGRGATPPPSAPADRGADGRSAAEAARSVAGATAGGGR
jgi:ABC-type transporter Mla subunit MlaD